MLRSRLMLLGVAMGSAACDRGKDTGSYVQVSYPCEPGAPELESLRVTWGLDGIALGKVEPGDGVERTMVPGGGGGPITVSVWIGGTQHDTVRWVGAYDDGQRYGVRITLDPFGSASVVHCRHPCPGSVRPWTEPWRGILAWLSRPQCR